MCWLDKQSSGCCIDAAYLHVCLQQPQIILLKEGTDTSQGTPQLVSNINACMALADTVRTTLGPRGMDKLIHDDKVSLTAHTAQHAAAPKPPVLCLAIFHLISSSAGCACLISKAAAVARQRVVPVMLVDAFRKPEGFENSTVLGMDGCSLCCNGCWAAAGCVRMEHGGKPVRLATPADKNACGCSYVRARMPFAALHLASSRMSHLAARTTARCRYKASLSKLLHRLMHDCTQHRPALCCCWQGRVTISNDGATIMKLLDVVHPAAKTLVDVSLSQDAEVRSQARCGCCLWWC